MMTRPWSTRSRRCSAPKAPTSSRQGRRNPHRGRPKDGFAHGRRERAPRDWNLSRRPCQRTTAPRNRNTRSETHQAERVSASGAGPRTPSRSMVPSKEAHLLKAVLGSARVTASILPALGAMNVWTPQTKADYAALSTAPCLGVCAVGPIGEDRVQPGHRQDLRVAHFAAEARCISRALGTSERVANRNLGPPTEGGWWSRPKTLSTPRSRLTG